MGTSIDEVYRESAIRFFSLIRHALEKEHDFFGLELPLIQQLAKLDSWGQYYLVQRAYRFVKITVDPQALNQQLEFLQKAYKERELENTFLEKGATRAMMQQLFQMHASVFSRRRRLLGMCGQGCHRPLTCDKKTEQVIWRYWHDYRHLEKRARYLKMTELTGQSLKIVFASVRTYDEAALPGNRHE